ncbi:hypothetical protein ONS95_010626 [Cadophora gregata]|uniref:uncharacterized protein n=1 Tax=Cadophora gregata TaxID=51156 RepID=UPI0026DB24A4|nr:uncharacterized protein ONS95_010626 [Cadophora gregata]KAK0122386.1 hypothetical protein ONS95_010626 [Cadophora gregata]KAK0127865.1 hypothetical protein ONS96_007366 [Cadophora gregata f. sp. sojae]
MPAKTPTNDGRPASSRPCPSTFDPNVPGRGPETPTPIKKNRGVASVIKSNRDKVSADKVTKPASMVPFRHKWMKKVNSKGIPFADLQAEDDFNANTSEDGQNTPNSAKSRSKTVDFSPEVTVNGTPGGTLAEEQEEINPLKPMKENDGEYDSDSGEMIDQKGVREEAYMDAEGNISQFVPRAMNNMEKARKKLKTENGLVDPNGRQVGRKLVLWHRKFRFFLARLFIWHKIAVNELQPGPRMIDKLVLHIQYECHKQGVQIPWDSIVHRLNPGSSGPSATQMLNKLRDVLVTEGHMIPPVLGKATSPVDPTLRGYIRDMDSPYPTKTKAVRWTDDVTDRKESLVVPGLVRGSGKYRKIPKNELVTVPKEDLKPGERRNRKPAEVDEWTAGQRALKESAKKARAEEREAKRVAKGGSCATGSGRSTRSKKLIKEESESEVDPADLASDEDYNPNLKKKTTSRGKRIVVGKISSPDPFTSPTPRSRKRSAKAALNYSTEDDDEEQNEEGNTPNSLIVKLHVPSGALQKFEPGESGMKPKNAAHFNPGPAKILFKDELLKALLQTEVASSNANHSVIYLGTEMHGTMPQFIQAVADDTDPRLNGTGFGNNVELMWKRCKENSSTVQQLRQDELDLLRSSQIPAIVRMLGGAPKDVMEVDGQDQEEDERVDYGDDCAAAEAGEASFNANDTAYTFDDSVHGSSSQQFSQAFTVSSFPPEFINPADLFC